MKEKDRWDSFESRQVLEVKRDKRCSQSAEPGKRGSVQRCAFYFGGWAIDDPG